MIDDVPDGSLQFEAAFAVHVVQEPVFIIDTLLNYLNAWGDPQCRPREVANLIRDIVGNPFRPVKFDAVWRTSTAVALAAQMYDSREFSAMPILADALQDAGCDNDDILNHCRDATAAHVRGCWVVDLVLGKE